MWEWLKNLFTKKKVEKNMDKERQYIERLLKAWEYSIARKMMFTGEDYYRGKQDILKKKRTTLNENGQEVELRNIINSRIVDNQYSKLVDQKVNYLVGKPLSFKSEDESYIEKIKSIINKNFLRKLKYTTENALNNGVGWMHPYYDIDGTLKIKQFEPTEILPVYKSKDKEEIEMVIRLYQEIVIGTAQTVEKVEVYKLDGVDRYVRKSGVLTVEAARIPYIVYTGGDEEKAFNWEKLPFIPFRYNQQEIPLIARVKSIQDAINLTISNFQDNVSEDNKKTMLVLVNYDGAEGETIAKMRELGYIKVSSMEGIQGDVKTLEIKVDAENYKTILNMLKTALIENGRGFDAKDERMGNNPNQMNIQSMYADIDLDANNMEVEFQDSLEKLLWFINTHLKLEAPEDFQIIFDRDVLVNETQTIENIQKSIEILSKETLVAMHPYVEDTAKELERLEKEQEKKLEVYPPGVFNSNGDDNGQKE